MNWKKFIAVNSYLIGTIIILAGFVWMFTQAILEVPFEQTLISFFFTISGIIFWWIGARTNPDTSPLEDIMHRTAIMH